MSTPTNILLLTSTAIVFFLLFCLTKMTNFLDEFGDAFYQPLPAVPKAKQQALRFVPPALPPQFGNYGRNTGNATILDPTFGANLQRLGGNATIYDSDFQRNITRLGKRK